MGSLAQRNYSGRGKAGPFPNEAEATAAFPGSPERQRDIPCVYRQRRGESYPTREEFFMAGPRSGRNLCPLHLPSSRRYGRAALRHTCAQNAPRPRRRLRLRVRQKGTRSRKILALVVQPGGATQAEVAAATDCNAIPSAGSWPTRTCAAPLGVRSRAKSQKRPIGATGKHVLSPRCGGHV